MRNALLALFLLLALSLHGQGAAMPVPGTLPAVPGAEQGSGGYRLIPPRVPPVLSPGVLVLLDQEGRFQQAVISGGGKAFGSFFTEDAVILSNGKPAVQGRGAIAAQAQWDPKIYQLTWSPEGAQMGPSGDMGYTWGHYDGALIDPSKPGSKPVVTSGRYITVWRKQKDGSWKVSMDASADEPPASPAVDAACCTVPHP